VQGCLLRGPASPLRQSGFAIQLRRDKELRRGLPGFAQGFAGASLRWDLRFDGQAGGQASLVVSEPPHKGCEDKRLLPEVGGEGRRVLRSGMAAE